MYEEDAPHRRQPPAGCEGGFRGKDGHRDRSSRSRSAGPPRGLRTPSRASRFGAAGARHSPPPRACFRRPLRCMIVLVDTSVWIRFLANREPYAAELDRLLGRDEVSGHDFVLGELLVGDKGGRRQLLADYEQMHQAPVIPHREVVAFVRLRRLNGRGVGWIDAHLLASALVGRLRLWTADPRLATLAKDLSVAYE